MQGAAPLHWKNFMALQCHVVQPPYVTVGVPGESAEAKINCQQTDAEP